MTYLAKHQITMLRACRDKIEDVHKWILASGEEYEPSDVVGLYAILSELEKTVIETRACLWQLRGKIGESKLDKTNSV